MNAMDAITSKFDLPYVSEVIEFADLADLGRLLPGTARQRAALAAAGVLTGGLLFLAAGAARKAAGPRCRCGSAHAPMPHVLHRLRGRRARLRGCPVRTVGTGC
ncbi:hypothetical protein [Streptomyces longispororuber]|uniref:hypothetical protein n=1 Tax=Streptomyces longispororuber TaxID=68230 RepID=UPI00370128C1